MKRINYLEGLASPPTSDTAIEIVEDKLLDLAIGGDWEASQQYADLYLSRLNWERTRSAEHRQNLVDQAQRAHAWVTVNCFAIEALRQLERPC